jgi:hypothetical protein
VNRCEVLVLVVHVVPICSASVPHAFLRPLGWITQELLVRGPAREYEGKRWRGPQAPRQLLFIMVNRQLTRWQNRRFWLENTLATQLQQRVVGPALAGSEATETPD